MFFIFATFTASKKFHVYNPINEINPAVIKNEPESGLPCAAHSDKEPKTTK